MWKPAMAIRAGAILVDRHITRVLLLGSSTQLQQILSSSKESDAD
jgi:hypothetical protein